ncbi:MAG: hypothetical protein APF83_06890 [Lutibacter sp. BRH_c52]|nr:MAG: hypothetical protein APF83_06890 [Lutibacter sp. BRH_c52]
MFYMRFVKKRQSETEIHYLKVGDFAERGTRGIFLILGLLHERDARASRRATKAELKPIISFPELDKLVIVLIL